MGVKTRNLYVDDEGVKRCKFLGKQYPEECKTCSHYVAIFCGCDYEEYYGEGIGAEEWNEKEKLTFKLVHKDYARENYESNVFTYEGKPVKAVVRMRYHTIRHYWHVILYFVYGENFKYATPYIEGKSYIKYRKDARKLAELIMESITTLTLHKTSQFHLNHIKEN